MHRTVRLACIVLVFVAVHCAGAARAAEYRIGKPLHLHGMQIAAVYLQPVTMEPEGMMRSPAASDIHLEADIHALAGNRHGFGEGAWVPYLQVHYTVVKDAAAASPASGVLMPMVASDGPHYGDNVKLQGPGKYRLVYRISPPAAGGGHAAFGRHTDRATGVRPWFEPFEVEFHFTFAGTGKKGAY
jgi:hypothetical protein